MNGTNPVFPLPDYERAAERTLAATSAVLPERPLISVVMTSYNSARWLADAMRSVLVQSWRHLELVVVDDCSTDESLHIALATATEDPRVVPLAMNRNGGTYSAKNAGMAAARGDVITFMDSDDTLHPERLDKQLHLLIGEDVVATTCNYERRNARGKLVMNRGLAARQALISLMMKRQVIEDIGWFDAIRAGADHEYFERLRAIYGRAAHANVPETLYLALARGDSLSSAAGLVTHTGDSNEELPSPARARYAANAGAWHSAVIARGRHPYMPHRPSGIRPFHCPAELLGDSRRSQAPSSGKD